MSRPSAGSRGAAAAVLAVALVLAAAWAISLRTLDRSPLTRMPVLDEAHYLREGAAVASGRWIPRTPAVLSPLYPYLVAVTGSGRTFDEHGLRRDGPPTGLRVVQLLMWLGTAWLLWREGRRSLPGWWAALPPILFLLYLQGAIDAAAALMEVPLTFLATLAIVLADGSLEADEDGAPGLRRGIAVGVVVGMAALLRGTALLLLAPVVLALRPRATKRVPAAAVAAAFAVMLPFALANSLAVGRVAGPSLNAGLNLYIGNGPWANGMYSTVRGFPEEGDPSGSRYLARTLGRPVPDAGVADRIWLDETRRYVAEHPWRTLRLWLRKIRLHLAGVEFPQITPFAAWTRTAPLLDLFCMPYGLLAAGGIAGAFLSRRRRRLRVWTGALLLLILSQSLFFVVSRYRLILVPGLALLTASALAELARDRGRDLARAAAVVVVAAAAVVPWGLGAARAELAAAARANEAARWLHLAEAALDGDSNVGDAAKACLAQAETLFRRAVAADPARPEGWRGLARVHLLSGRPDAACDDLRAGAAQAVPATGLRRELAGLLLEQKQAAEALPLLLHLLRASPDDPELLHETTAALSETGRTREAADTAHRLIAAAPDDPRGWRDLGLALARGGRLQEARDAFREGLRRHPDDTATRDGLDRVEKLLARDR